MDYYSGYRISRDYNKLKEYLDSGYSIILVWIHDTARGRRHLAAIATRVSPTQSGVDSYCYSLGIGNYFPQIANVSFEDYCKEQDFFYILPENL